MAKYYLKCMDCGEEYQEESYSHFCSKCGIGFVEAEIEGAAKDRKVDLGRSSVYKYHEFMPFSINDAPEDVEDYGDIQEFRDEAISDKLDIEVIIKDETLMPTGTWKDREGFISLYRMYKNGVTDAVVFSSGNTGISLIRSASLFKKTRLHLIVPKASQARLAPLLREYDQNYFSVMYFDGSNDECILTAKQFAKENNFPTEGGFENYARREGLKLLGLEHIHSTYDYEKDVDFYVQPVAGGIGIYSWDKAYRDSGLEAPKILGVQASICAPMVAAWEDKAETLEGKHIPSSVVESDYVRVLRTRNPGDAYRIVSSVVRRVGGGFVSANDNEIHEAIRTFYLSDYFKNKFHKCGRLIGLEPATALAGLLKAKQNGLVKAGDRVLLNVSGAAKSGDVKKDWIADLL
jgi:threonine synthase